MCVYLHTIKENRIFVVPKKEIVLIFLFLFYQLQITRIMIIENLISEIKNGNTDVLYNAYVANNAGAYIADQEALVADLAKVISMEGVALETIECDEVCYYEWKELCEQMNLKPWEPRYITMVRLNGSELAHFVLDTDMENNPESVVLDFYGNVKENNPENLAAFVESLPVELQKALPIFDCYWHWDGHDYIENSGLNATYQEVLDHIAAHDGWYEDVANDGGGCAKIYNNVTEEDANFESDDDYIEIPSWRPVESLYELADAINKAEDYPIQLVEKTVKAHKGWFFPTGRNDYQICSDGKSWLVFNENDGTAEVVDE